MNNTFIEFLLWYQSAAKTGRLYVSSGDRDGDIFLMEGCAVHAQSGDSFGLEAYLAMLLDWPAPSLMAWETDTLPRYQSLWLDHFSTMSLLSRFGTDSDNAAQKPPGERELRDALTPQNRHTISFLVNSPGLGEFTYDVSREFFLVGRAEGNELAIDDQSMSRQHCFITAQEKRLFIHDLNSANGTFINDQPVYFGTAEAGDKLRFGNVTCAFKIVPFRTAEDIARSHQAGKTTLIPREILQSVRNTQIPARPTLTHKETPAQPPQNGPVVNAAPRQKKTRPMGISSGETGQS